MAEYAIPKHGEICWRELTTNDSGAAKKFYQGLFGWNFENSKLSPNEYPEIQFDGKAIGGIMRMTEEWGDPPPTSHWMNYIAVDNVTATVEKIKANGGGVCVEPFDAPNVGRIAVVSDPSGATFSVIQFVAE